MACLAERQIYHYNRKNLSCKCVFISWSLMVLMQTALTNDHWQKSGRKHSTIGRKHSFIQKWPNCHGYNISRQQTSTDCVGTNKGDTSRKANHQRSIWGHCDIKKIHDLVVGSHFSFLSSHLFHFISSRQTAEGHHTVEILSAKRVHAKPDNFTVKSECMHWSSLYFCTRNDIILTLLILLTFSLAYI